MSGTFPAKRKILFIALTVLILVFVVIWLKLDTLKNLSGAFNYSEPWYNYKIESGDGLNGQYSFLYNALSRQPLPDEVKIKEFEHRTADWHGHRSFLRIWLEASDDQDLINETLDILSMPLYDLVEYKDTYFKDFDKFEINGETFSVSEAGQRVFFNSDSKVIIEVLREISPAVDPSLLPGAAIVDYRGEISEEEMKSVLDGSGNESDIYNAYQARRKLNHDLVVAATVIFICILIVLGLTISDFIDRRIMKQREAKNKDVNS